MTYEAALFTAAKDWVEAHSAEYPDHQVWLHCRLNDVAVACFTCLGPAGSEPQSARQMVSLDLYSEALDEIYMLRRALAYEAGGIVAHLSYKTFPKSRREIAQDQIKRMKSAARGYVETAYAAMPHWSMRHSLTEAGASPTLTRAEWEAERTTRGTSDD